MQRLILVLIGTLPHTAALAAEWTPLADFPTVAAEVDVQSLRQTGSYLEAKFRFNHNSPQINRKSGEGYLSAEVTSLFNCEKQTFAPIQRIEYKGKKSSGAEIGSVTVPNQQITFSKVLPGSMNQLMFDYVCSY